LSNYKVAVIVGSLRKGAFSRLTAQALIHLADSSLEFGILEIGQLSYYNQDLEDTPPAEWVDFRNRIRGFDAVLFVTPEYNRSVPAVLKNAIDVGSRPYGHSAWDGKPAAVVSVSPGGIGGFGANHHLRQSLVFLNMPTMQQPEAYVGGAAKLFGENGEVLVDGTRDFLKSFMVAFGKWIETHCGKR